MKFDNDGIAASAAWIWHEAFNSNITSMDFREVLNTFGVQFSARGGDGKTMDHCEKGIIQQAVAKLHVENPVAWAWGMHSYAPDGCVNANSLRNTLFEYAMKSIDTSSRDGGFNSFTSMSAGKLAYIAIRDARTESNTGKRFRRKSASMAELIRVDIKEYESVWRSRFFMMKDRLKDLSGQALPPIANVIWAMVDKKSDDFIERANAAEDLKLMLKMPVAECNHF